MPIKAERKPPATERLEQHAMVPARAVLAYQSLRPAMPLGAWLLLKGFVGHGLTDAQLAHQGPADSTELVHMLWSVMRVEQGERPESQAVHTAREEGRSQAVRALAEAARQAGDAVTVAAAEEVLSRAAATAATPIDTRPATVRATSSQPELTLSGYAWEALRQMAVAPLPQRELPPGVVKQLRALVLVELVELPSPYRMVRGTVAHLRLTDTGTRALRRLEMQRNPFGKVPA